MKKLFSFVAATAVVLGLTTACEDVPAPYELPTTPSEVPAGADSTLISETFASSLGTFKNYTTAGAGEWKIDFSTAKASGYDNQSKVTTAGTYYLVSKEVDLTDVKDAHIAFDYILRYNKGAENQQLLISDKFDEANAATGWTVLNQQWTEGSDWTTFYPYAVNIPAEFIGKKVRIAFRYNTNATSGSTWEVKNFTLRKGAAQTAPVTPEQPTGDTFVSEPFSTTLGSFTNKTTSGEGAWVIDFSAAKATGYNSTTKVTTAGTYYLVSKEIDLTGVTAANVALDYILRYNKGAENQQLLITAAYNDAAPATGWTVLNQEWTEGSDWKTYVSYAANIPAQFLGKKVRLALKYSTDAVSGSTWQVKNFAVKKGEVATTTPEQPSTPATPTAGNLVTNGDFETWSGGQPTGWKSSTTASSATLAQSTTARSGQYAVQVQGATQNKRIAYTEITLKAGTYTMRFYARGEAAGASVRPGYVAVLADGKADSANYKYGNYVNDIPADQWVEVVYEFTLDADTKLNLLVMNPKDKGNVLIDDFSLTTTNGGLVQ